MKTRLLNSKLLNIFVSKIKKVPWILGRNAFLFILIFILLDIIFGEFLFYQYVFLSDIEESPIFNISTKFKENAYKSVSEKIQVRENIFKNIPQENYADPFN